MAGHNDYDLSELERELESDLDSEFDFKDLEFGRDEENEGQEIGSDFEFENELDPEGESELDEELEFSEESEAAESDGPAAEYGERFFEIAEREFESPGSMDAALHEVLNEMGRDYFFKRAFRRLKKGIPGIKKLVGKGMQLAKAAGVTIPGLSALQNMSGLAQSLLQGNLAGVAKQALSAALKAHPGAAAAMPVMKALGFETDEPEARRRAWQNFAEVARESYENLADNLNETAHQPGQALQLAQKALQHGLQNAPLRAATRAGSGVARARGKVRVVRLGPDEKLLVIRRRPGQ